MGKKDNQGVTAGEGRGRGLVTIIVDITADDGGPSQAWRIQSTECHDL